MRGDALPIPLHAGDGCNIRHRDRELEVQAPTFGTDSYTSVH